MTFFFDNGNKFSRRLNQFLRKKIVLVNTDHSGRIVLMKVKTEDAIFVFIDIFNGKILRTRATSNLFWHM